MQLALTLLAAFALPPHAVPAAPVLMAATASTETTAAVPELHHSDRRPLRVLRRPPPPLRRLLRKGELIERRSRAAGLDVQDDSLLRLERQLAHRTAALLYTTRHQGDHTRISLRLILAGVTDATLHTPPPSLFG